MYKVDVPYWVMMGKKKPKPFYLNLNTYRNAHFQKLNKAKEAFHDTCKDRLQGLPIFSQVALTYTLYPKTNQLCDTANICCIVDKFVCDSLVECGRLRDDNYQIVKTVAFHFGNVDKENPRVEVSIEPMGAEVGSTGANDHIDHYPKEKKMQITLVQKEIETALRNYVTSSVDVQAGKEINITLRATRGAEGYQAVIDIVDAAGNDGSTASDEAGEDGAGANTGTLSPQAEPEVEASTGKKGSLFSGAKEVENA